MLDVQQARILANPAASGNANSASIDIGPSGGAFIQNGQLRFDIPAMPNLGNGETHTITIQDSADNSNWASAVGYATIVTTGPASGGSPAQTVRRSVMQGLRRYVRINVARGTGGNVTAQSVTFGLEV
jgi:hypothetical protein